MCQKCVDAVKKYWPKLPDKDYKNLLLCCTAFPFADPETTAQQVKEMAEKSGQNMDLAIAIADEETRKAMVGLKTPTPGTCSQNRLEG